MIVGQISYLARWDRRRAIDRLKADEYRQTAKAHLNDNTHLADALAGDEEAVAQLIRRSPEPSLGWVALAAYFGGTPRSAFQELLRAGWRAGWRIFQYTFREDFSVQMRRVFKAGRYEHTLPDGLRTIYRGVGWGELALSTASRGLSWTTSRDVACWFAYRERDPSGYVITSRVDVMNIIYHDDETWESEVVLRRHTSAKLDDDPTTWRASARRYAELHKLEYLDCRSR